MTERAPAKVNLCLFVGPVRERDGRHELVSLMQSLEWGDEVTLEPADADEVICEGVDGPNLAAEALKLFRDSTGELREPHRLSIVKRIPVAAGLGGGSADAAATLRLAARSAGIEPDRALAAALGADVPAQLRPGRALAEGAGESVHELDPPEPFGVLVLPSHEQLSTAAVYGEFDRLGLPRELTGCRDTVLSSLGTSPLGLPPELLVNDLEPAARSLCPAIEEALAAAREAGADHAMVAGSGPTVLGLFADPAAAERAAAVLERRDPAPVATTPLTTW